MVSNRLKYGALIAFVIAISVLLIGGLISRNKLAPYWGQLLSQEDGSQLADKATILRGNL